MFINQGAANGRKATFRHNGAFELRWLCWAYTLGGGFAKRALENSDVQHRLANVDVRDVLENGPIQQGTVAAAPHPRLRGVGVRHHDAGAASDELWQEPGLNFEAYYDESADVPTVYSGAWYDSYTKATCDNFEALAERKDSDHYLLMGPWTHGWNTYPLPSWNKSYSGELEFGEQAPARLPGDAAALFDHYLKGEDTWGDQPTVQYFQMGTGDGSQTRDGRLRHSGEWRSGEEWPLPDTEFTTYYIHEDGRLSTDEPTAEDAATSYEFDPSDPVPTSGQLLVVYHLRAPRRESHRVPARQSQPARHHRPRRLRPAHASRYARRRVAVRSLEERNDVLVYRTEPLKEDLEITGPIRVSVFGSTDAPDTDFTAKLIDEYPPSEEFPNGFAVNLADSICRGRYRGYRDEPDLLEPGEVYEFEMEPYPTANVFKAGHRIRLDISSSNYPRFDVNHNTGGPLYGDRESQIATNTVHHDAEYATQIELPVQPR